MKKEKQKDPAFLMYAQDFLTGVTFMTDEQVGKYIRLLCLQHQKGHMTTEQMCKILQDDDVEVFEKFRQDQDGKWYNVKLDQEIERRAKYSEYQSELAKRRWNKDAKASAESKAKDMPTNMPNECMRTETETVTEESLFTIETNSPKLLFSKEPVNPIHNSLEDLYDTL
jgi:hypothetical protein